MARTLSLAFAFVSLLALSACGGGDPHEKLMKETAGVMTEFGATLAKVTDKASAQKQVPQLEKLSQKMNDIQTRMEKLGDPSEEVAASLEKKMETEMSTAMATMMKETTRLSANPEVMAILEPALSKMGG
jgi:hypothetical protein